MDTEGLIRADDAAQAAGKLVDRIAYRDEVYRRTARPRPAASRHQEQPFKQIAVADYAKHREGRSPRPRQAKRTRLPAPSTSTGSGRGRIAIVYAEGEIVDGDGNEHSARSADRNSPASSASLRQDDSVKRHRAAREQPRRQRLRLRGHRPRGAPHSSKVKPVDRLDGHLRRLGRLLDRRPYGDRIFAEPTTITGIDRRLRHVQFDVQRNSPTNFGLTFDSVKTGKFADAITIIAAQDRRGARRLPGHGRLDLRRVHLQGRRGPRANSIAPGRRGDRAGPRLVRAPRR